MDTAIAEKERKFDRHMKLLREAKDLSVHGLLLEIRDKYPGSDLEKLRDEARDTFKIDSVHDYNFGITGQSGVGKSTLINAICGYDDNDHRAAKVHIVECTEKVERYPHPSLKYLALYDLPGAGTTGHPSHTYFCDKRLYVFDCLLLVMSERIRETDLAIAKLAQEMGTPVIFVRNKSMNDLKTMRNKLEYKDVEEKELINLMISMIKENIYKELSIAKIENPNVFVVESHSLSKFTNISLEEFCQLENIIKFEELALLEHITKLVNSRSGLPPKDLKSHKESSAME